MGLIAGVRMTDARALFDELAQINVDGRRCFALAGDTSFREPADLVSLLPEYDVYVMGFREHDQLVPPPVRELVAQQGGGRYEGPAGVWFVLIDGVAAGSWEHRKRGTRIELDVLLTRRVTKAERAELPREAERIAVFLGLEPVFSVGRR